MSPYNSYTNITKTHTMYHNNCHTIYHNNWTSYRLPHCSVGNSLMPAMHNPVHAQMYHHAGTVLPHMPFVVQRCETVKKCHTYTAYIPHGTYLPQNEVYTKKIPDGNASEQYHFDSEKEYQINYETEDNNMNSYRHDINTSTTDGKMNTTSDAKEVINDPLDFYLTLPKELFPSPKNFMIDPNPLIDEFCKLSNVENHAPWILDLEFGIRKGPITRAFPVYNVKLNSVNCLSDPSVIHPDFDKCNQDFKRVFLFYYDCIVSTWYKGYIILNSDSSVDNFQSWLSLPIQVLGMCWS